MILTLLCSEHRKGKRVLAYGREYGRKKTLGVLRKGERGHSAAAGKGRSVLLRQL